MKRTPYIATVEDATGAILGTAQTFARNSANDAGLDVLRDLGGAERVPHGVTWDAHRRVCVQRWTLTRDGRPVTITVQPDGPW